MTTRLRTRACIAAALCCSLLGAVPVVAADSSLLLGVTETASRDRLQGFVYNSASVKTQYTLYIRSTAELSAVRDGTLSCRVLNAFQFKCPIGMMNPHQIRPFAVTFSNHGSKCTAFEAVLNGNTTTYTAKTCAVKKSAMAKSSRSSSSQQSSSISSSSSQASVVSSSGSSDAASSASDSSTSSVGPSV